MGAGPERHTNDDGIGVLGRFGEGVVAGPDKRREDNDVGKGRCGGCGYELAQGGPPRRRIA